MFLGRTVIALDLQRAGRWLGLPLSAVEVRTLLARFSCRVAALASERANLRVEVPTFRRDLTQEADLYEEIARGIGYDRIPAVLYIRQAFGSPKTTGAGAS